MLRTAGSAASGAAVALAVSALLVPFSAIGPQSVHMGAHILSMNVLAPLLAAFVVARWRFASRPALLWATTGAQVAVIWAWHAPVIHTHAMSHPWLQLGTHFLLFVLALAFWASLLALSSRRWHAVAALLLTGKLTCLLAALLLFAPRTLYEAAEHALHGVGTLDDQHLAALVMIAACPLSYLVPAVVITIQLISPRRWPAPPVHRSLRTAAS